MIKFFKNNKLPQAITDLEYVDIIFNELKRIFHPINESEQNAIWELLNNNKHLEAVMHYADCLELKVKLLEGEESTKYKFGVPQVFIWKRPTEDDSNIRVFLTPFAFQNQEIAFCELIILMTSFKIGESNFFIPQEIRDDESQYMQLLVVASVFFGLGYPFLERNNISTFYKRKTDDQPVKLNYVIHLHFGLLVYAYALYNYSFNQSGFNMRRLANNIQNEYKICLSYLRNR